MKQLTMGRTEFDDATRVGSTSEAGVFEAELSDGWTSMVGVHGGYLAESFQTRWSATV